MGRIGFGLHAGLGWVSTGLGLDLDKVSLWLGFEQGCFNFRLRFGFGLDL